MAGNFSSYKLSPRNISLDKDDLRRLIDFIVEKTNETKEAHRATIDISTFSPEQINALRVDLDEAYKVAVFVYGSDGEEHLVYDSTIINSPQFPEVITRITIDSFMPFKNRVPSGTPRNGVRIDLDFSSAAIFDWQTNVSAPTPNASEVEIQGIDSNLATSTLSYLQRLFSTRKNHRNFLHGAFTYDTYLWAIALPIYFYTVISWEPRIDAMLGGISAPMKVALYVYSFLIFVNLYRILIGYVRWTFQTIELTGVRSTQNRHRQFWIFIATAILLPVVIQLIAK